MLVDNLDEFVHANWISRNEHFTAVKMGPTTRKSWLLS